MSAEAVAGIERLVDAGKLPASETPVLAARLAPYYEATENHERWAGALEAQLAAAETDAARHGLLETLADLQGGPLKNPERALDAGSVSSIRPRRIPPCVPG